MQYIVRRDNELLDEIIYNTYGIISGYLEQTISLNKDIEQNIFLPINTVIELLDIKEQEVVQQIKLWS